MILTEGYWVRLVSTDDDKRRADAPTYVLKVIAPIVPGALYSAEVVGTPPKTGLMPDVFTTHQYRTPDGVKTGPTDFRRLDSEADALAIMAKWRLAP